MLFCCRVVASCRFSNLTKNMTNLAKILDVDIDSNGIFKYILIKVSDKTDNKIIVRGYVRCGFHADIFDEVRNAYSNFKFECLGGGRINHEAAKKKIKIYGYSQGFGQADHQIAAKLIKDKYPGYEVTCSNDGY